jgi:hypothetical protein
VLETFKFCAHVCVRVYTGAHVCAHVYRAGVRMSVSVCTLYTRVHVCTLYPRVLAYSVHTHIFCVLCTHAHILCTLCTRMHAHTRTYAIHRQTDNFEVPSHLGTCMCSPFYTHTHTHTP